jgi:hypothetical protein
MVNLLWLLWINGVFRMKRFLSLLLASITVLSVNAMEKAPSQGAPFSFGAQPAGQRPSVPFRSGFGAPVAQPGPFGSAVAVVPTYKFSNQSDHLVAIWVWMQGKIPPVDSPLLASFGGEFTPSWQNLMLAPVQDYNRTIMSFQGKLEPIHIYTAAGFYMLHQKNRMLELTKEIPAGQGKITSEIIKTLPFNESIAILVIINPDGTVNFVKHE